MGYLVAIGAFLLLWAAFLGVTVYEKRRGARFFERVRAGLDKRVNRLLFIMEHVDFNSFIKEQARLISLKLAHDIAHLSLLVVRSSERLLTRLVKNLRSRHEVPVVEGAPRAFVKAMTDFKQQLSTTRPSLPDLS